MTQTLTPSEMKEFVTNALMLREIPYVAGPPGIGKSDIVAQVADDFGLKLLDIRLSQMLPEDLTGLPSLDAKTGKAEYNPFSTFPMAGDKIPDGFNGWLIFLDEMSSASEEVFAAIYSLLLGHRVGGKPVHPKALIVAAGNRATDSAIARELPDTLISRMLPATMSVSSRDWLMWATDPATKGHEGVVDFIKKYPDLLNTTVDPAKREELETFPTPRGWGKAMKVMHFHEKMASKNKITRKDSAGIPMDTQTASHPITPQIHALLEAAVGMAAAKSFQEHYDESISLPYPWEIAQSPASARVPNNTIGKAKLTADLAEFFIGTQEQSRDALLIYMNRLEPEQAALFVQTLVEKLGDTPSDRKMIQNVKKRLNVTDINVPSAAAPDQNDPQAGGMVFPRGTMSGISQP
jgi:hypothetical protein